MNFDIYCDESRPDLFASQNPPAQYLVIGSTWLRRNDRELFKGAIHQLRDKYHIGGEFKWLKVSPSKINFYEELISWFFDQHLSLRFRCIAIDHQKVNLVHFHDGDQELGFYKFYYQMLHHWILDFNKYTIFCDTKTNKHKDRFKTLQRCLNYSNIFSEIENVQAIHSKESVLIQLTDVLTGIVSARLNQSINCGSAKERLVNHTETLLNKKIKSTPKTEEKLNVFCINLEGGW